MSTTSKRRFARSRHSLAIGSVLAGLAVSACGGHRAASGPPALTERCGRAYADLHAQTFWFRAADGTRLAGATIGRSRRTVVLATEYPANQCSWLDYARVLGRAGFGVFLFDFRGLGASARARRAGAANRYQSDVRGAVDQRACDSCRQPVRRG